ncbi:MAG: D-alanine--D-alanine ligase [Myxococcales bacterium]|nr:D-alanine--D-alanine ligase [Myxococcales bacterium]
MDRRTKVGVLLGGMSAERDVSLKSGAAVAGALRRRGWDVVEIDVGRDLPARLVAEGVGAAWLALHGRFGEDGCVQGLCEVMGIPYTGSDVRASAVCMDKTATKRAVADVPGLVMARDVVWRAGDPVPTHLGFPVMVKPPSTGSTIGMTKAEDAVELEAGLEAALEHGETVLLEEFVTGDEITVAVIDGQALPVVRILPESGFFDYAAKYTKGMTRYEVPAAIDERSARLAQEAAVAAYRAIGCRGLCRADFIVREDGQPVFLEINTLPGMTETSLSPMAAGTVGISFEDLVERILDGATCMTVETH